MMAASPAAAQSRGGLVSAGNPASVSNALQAAGYRAVVSKDNDGDPMIESASNGSSFTIFFLGCTRNTDCRTLQFYSGYRDPKNASLDAMNQWNATHRFARGYVTQNGSARVEMDLDLDDGGMSPALFEDNLEFWVALMSSFEKYVYNR